MKYKVVDKTAPRYRKTGYETRLVVNDLHKEFVETTGIQMSQATFRTIYNESMDVIKDIVATERNGVILPEQMGNVYLAFFKIKRPFYNFQIGIVTGEGPVNNFFHSDGLQGKIVWDYKIIKYKPRDYRLYGFTACRDLKKRASKAFVETPEIFPKLLFILSETSKKKKLIKNERNSKRSDQPVESSQQSGELGQQTDQ